MNSSCMISVCGPRESLPKGVLKLAVASHALSLNANGWKDLWRLSPFSTVDHGITVPGLAGVKSNPFAHAFIVAMAVKGGLRKFIEDMGNCSTT